MEDEEHGVRRIREGLAWRNGSRDEPRDIGKGRTGRASITNGRSSHSQSNTPHIISNNFHITRRILRATKCSGFRFTIFFQRDRQHTGNSHPPRHTVSGTYRPLDTSDPPSKDRTLEDNSPGPEPAQDYILNTVPNDKGAPRRFTRRSLNHKVPPASYSIIDWSPDSDHANVLPSYDLVILVINRFIPQLVQPSSLLITFYATFLPSESSTIIFRVIIITFAHTRLPPSHDYTTMATLWQADIEVIPRCSD